MTDNPVQQNALVTFVETHPFAVIGGIIVGGVLLGTFLKNRNANTQAAAVSTTGQLIDNSGLNYRGQYYDPATGTWKQGAGTPVAFVPTQTSFTNNNVGAQFNGGTPNVSVQATNTIMPNTVQPPRPAIIMVTPPPQTAVVNPVAVPTPPPANTIPPPTPAPIATPAPAPVRYGLVWNYPYTVKSGDTLSGIAANLTSAARAAGMPSSQTITWNMLYDHNKSVIDSTASAHGNPIPGGPWNNIFPGERLSLVTWVRI